MEDSRNREEEFLTKSQRRKRNKRNNKLLASCIDTDSNSKRENSLNHFLNIYGSEAIASLEFRLNQNVSGKNNSTKSYLKTKDIRDLILWILGDGLNPTWVFVKNKPLIPQIVLLVVSCISFSLFEEHKSSFKFLSSIPMVQTNAPGAKTHIYSFLDILLNIPSNEKTISTKRQKKQCEINPDSENNKRKEHPSFYMLTISELAALEYPLPNEDNRQTENSVDWFQLTPRGKPLDLQREMLAIDCEMCVTSAGFELTRISIVDECLQVIYDKFVLPPNPILDYVTRYSGITPEKLIGVRTTLKEVQEDLKQLIPAETILVGHSLENDFRALKLVHLKVIDTVALYPHPQGVGYKSALRFLVSNWLNRKIQENEHDSIVDAIACMELVQLKIRNGPSFGETSQTKNLFITLDKCNNKCAMIDHPFMLKQYATVGNISAISCITDKQTMEQTVKLASERQYRFIWAQFYSVDNYFKRLIEKELQEKPLEEISACKVCISSSNDEDSSSNRSYQQQHYHHHHHHHNNNNNNKLVPKETISTPMKSKETFEVTSTNETLKEILECSDQYIEKIYQSLPKNSLLVVTTGHGDIYRYRNEYRRGKTIAQGEGYQQRSMETANEQMQMLVDQTRNALSFLKIK